MKGITLKKHKVGCGALGAVTEGAWDHPWGLCSSKFLPRDKTGRKRPTLRLWLVWGCNDPGCDAELGFLMKSVEEALGLREGKEEGK